MVLVLVDYSLICITLLSYFIDIFYQIPQKPGRQFQTIATERDDMLFQLQLQYHYSKSAKKSTGS